MNKYLIEFSIGFLNHKRRDVIESSNLKDAIDFSWTYAQASYPTDEIMSVSARRLWMPCPYCFTEQIDCYGCPNINCISKKK
jgi:hypothetical protein